MIDMTGVQARYGRTQALLGIDLRIDRGITAVVGPNGAGKTTLLRLLATAIEPTQGTVRILGLNPRDPRERMALRQNLGYLPQDTDTNANPMAVGELLDYLAVVKGHSNRHQRLSAIARVVTDHRLEPHLEGRIRDLSAGVRRRVMLAQVFLGTPRVLILDEPFTDLDPEQRREAQVQINATRLRAVSVVSTHDVDGFVAESDTVVVMHEGRVRFLGSPAELSALAHPGARHPDQADVNGLEAGYAAAIGT